MNGIYGEPTHSGKLFSAISQARRLSQGGRTVGKPARVATVGPNPMKVFYKTFVVGHFVISVMFAACAFALIFFAGLELWQGLQPFSPLPLLRRLDTVLESVALLTVALAALELSQTILEEEVQREAHMSAPTRVRRFLSRFMVVLVVALSIEALVAVFRFSHEAPGHMPYAGIIGLMAAALLAAWGVFIRLNRSAEELEPEAMEQAKQEDEKFG
jgi:hypothetical protein